MAVQTVTDITEAILNQLRTSDPSVSAEVGTPEREFIEAVAEQIASAQVDFTVLDSQHDVSTMTGTRLESYLSLFGFQRQQGVSASGTVTFYRNSVATEDIVIPVGTPVNATASDPSFPDVTFFTTQTVTLSVGGLEVDAPAQAALPGTIGNVAANSVTGFAGTKTIIGIVGIRNDAAMSGGTDPEDDDAFRIRFQNTIFRNMAGTNDQYLALAVSQPNVTKAVVLGTVSRYQEYIQVPASDDTVQRTDTHDAHSSDDKNYDPGSGGAADDSTGTNWSHKRTSALSSIPYSKYTYDQQYYVVGPDGSTFLRPDVDYVFNRKPIDPAVTTNHVRHYSTAGVAAHQPNVTFLASSAWPRTILGMTVSAGDVVLLEHAYISSNSRNDITAGVMNAVDVFVNGSSEKAVKSAENMPGNGHVLQSTNSAAWTYQHPSATTVINFRRFLDGSPAEVGNKIVPLFWQPVMSVPDTITIRGSGDPVTFYRARYYDSGEYYYDSDFERVANYFGVYESSAYFGTIRARSGIEFRDGKNGFLAGDDPDTPTSGVDALDNSFVGNQFIGSLSYTYDQNIGAIQAIIEQNKQITTDVLVHAAKNRYFHLNVTVMYAPGATRSVVDAAVAAAVSGYFNNQYFGSTIQLSDLLQIIHNVPGIDNVRWTHDVDSAVHKVEEVFVDGSAITSGPSGGFTIVSSHSVTDNDFYLQDNELAASPTANLVTIQVRAQNTWTA